MLNLPRGVGFLRYWTLSNLPLFLLATPMILVLICSGLWAWRDRSILRVSRPKGRTFNKRARVIKRAGMDDLSTAVMRRLALPQIVLATLALTTYHVQIITRLSSGYPVWYWWLASLIADDAEFAVFGKHFRPAKSIVRWMVIYAFVQGGLFASFLPPA